MDGNYEPVWTRALARYVVAGRWPEKLWKARKLTHEKYQEYIFLCRDGQRMDFGFASREGQA